MARSAASGSAWRSSAGCWPSKASACPADEAPGATARSPAGEGQLAWPARGERRRAAGAVEDPHIVDHQLGREGRMLVGVAEEAPAHREVHDQVEGLVEGRRPPVELALRAGRDAIAGAIMRARAPPEVLGRIEHAVDVPADGSGLPFQAVDMVGVDAAAGGEGELLAGEGVLRPA